MTTILDIQNYLVAHGYHVVPDGQYGPATKQALLAAMAAGPDTPIQPSDVSQAALVLSTTPAHIRTVRDVEAAGAGFANGLPKILFEGHIFSRLTGGKFDGSHPRVSYPHWDKSKYPGTQSGRYDQLLEAVGLDPDAAFAAASYGAFQILGSNYKVCGFNSAFEFVMAQCQTEGAQLLAFVNFVKGNHLDAALREGRWADFARGYNGSAYAANQYDVKLANAFAKESQAEGAALSGSCRITAKVNLRDAPNGAILGILPAGGFVNFVKDLGGGWAQVNYAPGKNGVVSSQFLAKA